MKFALVVLVLLPLALGASFQEKRFVFGDNGNLFGSLDIQALASQIACDYGRAETEQYCETDSCPKVVNHIVSSPLFQRLLCTACCKELEVLVKTNPGHFLTCPQTN